VRNHDANYVGEGEEDRMTAHDIVAIGFYGLVFSPVVI
jgi:hypothetical protein